MAKLLSKVAKSESQYHHPNLKAALVKAAYHLVKKSGLENFTLREVARRAGVSHNAPYRHFRGKEDLIAELATDSLRDLCSEVEAAAQAPAEPQERLRAAARGYLQFALKHPSRFQLTFHSAFDRTAYPDYVAAYTDALSLLSRILGAAIAGSAGPTADVETAAELIWSSIHGICELGLSGRLRYGSAPELEQLAVTSVDTLVAGVSRAPVQA